MTHAQPPNGTSQDDHPMDQQLMALLADLTDEQITELGDLAEAMHTEQGRSRFSELAAKVGSKELAAWIGRKKYGKEGMAALAAAGRAKKKATKKRSQPDLCLRSFDFEFDEPAGDGRTLEGYAAVFNTPATIRDVSGDFEETILHGAFKRSLTERAPILQWDHGKDPRIGTAPIGAIEDLAEDSRGLHVRARLFDHPDIERVRMAIEARAIKGMSFRFGVPNGGDAWPTPDRREIREADVHELGPVAFPAYDATTVSVRSLLAQLDPDEHRALIRELAAEVRDEHRELIHQLATEIRQATDTTDLTGRPDVRSVGGGDTTGPTPGNSAVPRSNNRQRLDDGALRARGIIT